MKAALDQRPALAPPFEWRAREGLEWIEAELGGGRAAFSTRRGGSSEGAFSSLNLGILTEDDPVAVARNRETLASALDRDPEAVAIGLQVHGVQVESHLDRPARPGYARRGSLPEADGHATAHPDVTPLVLVADCVPLVLSADGAVAAVHCGWRGVAAGIVGKAVEAVGELADTTATGVSAALGPGIRQCCYEVGEAVVGAFDAGRARLLRDGRFDLAAAIAIELERAGVDPAAIADCGVCTSCHRELFFSHRRDGRVTGRQAGLAWRV
jgi:YfiH family protein